MQMIKYSITSDLAIHGEQKLYISCFAVKKRLLIFKKEIAMILHKPLV